MPIKKAGLPLTCLSALALAIGCSNGSGGPSPSTNSDSNTDCTTQQGPNNQQQQTQQQGNTGFGTGTGTAQNQSTASAQTGTGGVYTLQGAGVTVNWASGPKTYSGSAQLQELIDDLALSANRTDTNQMSDADYKAAIGLVKQWAQEGASSTQGSGPVTTSNSTPTQNGQNTNFGNSTPCT